LAPSKVERGDFMSHRRTLALTLLWLAHLKGFFKLSESFAMGLSIAHGCYKRGIAAISKLQEQFIKEPSTVADVRKLIDNFSGRGFSNACLALDGCHIKVELTDQYHGLQDFICYKGFYSLSNVAYKDGKGFFKVLLYGWARAFADEGGERDALYKWVAGESQLDEGALLEEFLTCACMLIDSWIKRVCWNGCMGCTRKFGSWMHMGNSALSTSLQRFLPTWHLVEIFGK